MTKEPSTPAGSAACPQCERTNGHYPNCPTIEAGSAAAVPLAVLRARLEHIHSACMDTRPKQTVGEMIAAMLNMPEWLAGIEPQAAVPLRMLTDDVLRKVYGSVQRLTGNPASVGAAIIEEFCKANGLSIGATHPASQQVATGETIAWAIPSSGQFSWVAQDERFWTALVQKPAQVEPAQAPSELPLLPQSLINTIGEYGMARTDGASPIEVTHRWELLIKGIKDYTRAARPSAGADTQDAERYRWLRLRAYKDGTDICCQGPYGSYDEFGGGFLPDSLDAAIDAARQEGKGGAS